MAGASMPWVKQYTATLDDTDLGRISREYRWTWNCLELLAGECDAEGYLVKNGHPMSLDDIAWRLHETAKYLERAFAALVNIGYLENTDHGWKVSGFSSRQGRSQSEKRDQWRTSKAKARVESRGPDWENTEKIDEIEECPIGLLLDSNESPTPRVEESREEGEAEKSLRVTAPTAELLIAGTPEGAILKRELDRYNAAKKRKAPVDYKSPQQRDAFLTTFGVLGGELEPLIIKGISRERISLPQMLAWLESCAKNRTTPPAAYRPQTSPGPRLPDGI